MYIQLSDEQIKRVVSQAVTEVEREIYSISFDYEEIIINGSWSTKWDFEKEGSKGFITAIENYCTRSNIEWEYNSEYSVWCD